MTYSKAKIKFSKKNKGHTDVKHDGIRWNKMWFFRFLPSVCGPFPHHNFGQPSNKTISKYGNPSPALIQFPPSLPPLSLLLSRSLPAAGARREAAKFIFSLVVPLGWWRGPRRAPADVLGEGPLRDVGGTLLLLLHLILLFLLKDTSYCSYFSSSSSFI